MIERTDSAAAGNEAPPGPQRAKAILVDLADAARSAALAAAEQHKQHHVRQAGAVAEGMRAAARSLDRSQSPIAARYADQAAERVEALARSLDERSLGEIIGDVGGVARRRPGLFALGAVAVGFLAGRLFSDPIPRDSAPQTPVVGSLQRAETVKAAVASAGNGALIDGIDQGSVPRENS
jgi:hypothetical protein